MAANIYVPQTGEIYPSAAAAARALGVDASNVGKVLRGARSSAGGFNFIKVDPNISPQSLKMINQSVDTGLTEKQKRKKAQRRQASKAKARAAQRARTKAAKELHQTLVEANSLMKEYEKRGLSGISGIIPELEALKRVVGENKRGFFNADLKNLKRFKAEDLSSINEAVKRQLNRKGFRDLDDQEKKKGALAFQLGLQVEELEKYTDVLPTLWHILDLARLKQGEDYNETVYDEVMVAMQDGVDPEELQEILAEVEDEHENLEDKIEEYRAKTGEDPDYEDLISPYLQQIREMRESIHELETELNGEDGEEPPEDNTFNGYLSPFE